MADEGGNQKVLTCSQSMKKRSCCVCTRSKSIIRDAIRKVIRDAINVTHLHEEQVNHLKALGDEEDDDEDLEGHPRAHHVHTVGRAGDWHEEEELVLGLV